MEVEEDSGIARLAQLAEERSIEFEQDDGGMIVDEGDFDMEMSTKKDTSRKAYNKEFKKVIEQADVVLYILDARDPEGTRSKDGWLGRWRHGAARLAVEYGLPVVPVALRGTYGAMPRGRSWPVKGRLPVSVRYGSPIRPEPGEEFPALSRRMQQELARLCDEDASTWWQSLRRAAEERTPALTGPDAPRWRRIWEASRPLPRRTTGRVWPSP